MSVDSCSLHSKPLLAEVVDKPVLLHTASTVLQALVERGTTVGLYLWQEGGGGEGERGEGVGKGGKGKG